MSDMEKCTFETTITRRATLPYLLYKPPQYEARDSWPLVMFLHGMGERGTDLTRVPLHGLARHIAAGEDFPFVALMPQCPPDSYWPQELDALEALLEHVSGTLKIDTQRVYLTGLSMGGYGTWHLAARCPQRFAAIAPICGGGLPWLAERIKDIPVWAFHGDKDDIVPTWAARSMVRAVREAGGNAKLTLYHGVGHDSWTQTYANPKLYTWLLKHQRQ
jgi:predicted peptidase